MAQFKAGFCALSNPIKISRLAHEATTKITVRLPIHITSPDSACRLQLRDPGNDNEYELPPAIRGILSSHVGVEWRPLLFFVLVEAVDVLEQVGGVGDHGPRFYHGLRSNAFF
jgi:hypothetical protein